VSFIFLSLAPHILLLYRLFDAAERDKTLAVAIAAIDLAAHVLAASVQADIAPAVNTAAADSNFHFHIAAELVQPVELASSVGLSPAAWASAVGLAVDLAAHQTDLGWLAVLDYHCKVSYSSESSPCIRRLLSP